jgi:hypothetical protein
MPEWPFSLSANEQSKHASRVYSAPAPAVLALLLCVRKRMQQTLRYKLSVGEE